MSGIPVSINIGAATVYPFTNFQPFTITQKGIGHNGQAIKQQIRCVPLQFNYVSNSIWVVSMTSQLLNIFDAIRAMYVDNTKANNDVYILNVTTGYQITVPAKSSGFYPFFAQDGDLSFYVSNSGGTGTDITNVYVLDTFYPPANFPEYQRVLTYGMNTQGQIVIDSASTDIFGNPASNIVANKNLFLLVPLSSINGSSEQLYLIPPSTSEKWYIESAFFNLYGAYTASFYSSIFLCDGPTIILSPTFYIGSNINYSYFTSYSGLKYQSLGTGGLSIYTNVQAPTMYLSLNLTVSY